MIERLVFIAAAIFLGLRLFERGYRLGQGAPEAPPELPCEECPDA